jgi:3D (Asp-Asp-Asp) domain-containing protein
MRTAVICCCVALTVSWARDPHRYTRYHCLATAFSIQGLTAEETRPHLGVVAADPSFLPLGTRIRIQDAGPYDGIYTVRDTGSKIVGRHVDIYLPNRSAAQRFGKKSVWIQVVKWGDEAVTGHAGSNTISPGFEPSLSHQSR